MARMNHNFYSLLSGKLGPIVFAHRNGNAYVRSKPRKSRKKPTQKQVEQRQKFSLVNKFLRSMLPLLDFGFQSPETPTSPYSRALSYNMLNAIGGMHPNLHLVYEHALLTRGILPNASDPRARFVNDNSIRWTWTNNAGKGKAAHSDTSLLIVYCPALNETLVEVGTERNTEESTLNAEMFAGYRVETWISFMSLNGNAVADSCYTGSLEI